MWRKLAVLACAASSLASARPYRAMVTRTAETVPGAHVEVGLRYQGFIFGIGHLGLVSASPWHQGTAHARWGIIDGLELGVELEALVDFTPGGVPVAYFGDIPLGLQWTFLDRQHVALGVFLKFTIPTGPGYIDVLPPTLSDGTFDVEGTFLAEVRPNTWFRLLFNVGFVYMGVRHRIAPQPDFDVPEAIKWGVAATFNLGSRWLFAIEAAGHSFFRREITPVWLDNQHLVELIPGVRFEIIPRLVFEAGAGIALTRDLREIYQLRLLLGLTYEFGGK